MGITNAVWVHFISSSPGKAKLPLSRTFHFLCRVRRGTQEEHGCSATHKHKITDVFLNSSPHGRSRVGTDPAHKMQLTLRNTSSQERDKKEKEEEMWYWVFLWCLFSSLFLHGAAGLLMLVMLQRHKRGRLITLVLVSVGFLASLSGGVITSAAVAGVYRVAGKDMAPLEALVFGVGQTALSVIISFSRVLATL
ncbi:transmembrane protein 170B isoform 1-T1 [Spinachia spinachia]